MDDLSPHIAALDIPEEWRIAELKEFAKVKGGKRMPKGRPFALAPTPYPYIRVSNLKNGTVDTTDLRYVLPEDQEKIKRYTISKEDLYISIAGTLGVVGTIPDDLDGAQLTENAAKITLDGEGRVSKEFLKFFLSGQLAQRQIGVLKGVGSGVPKLALFRIETIQTPLPPLPEQRKIAAILSSVDEAIEATQAVIDQVQVVKKGLMQELLTKGIPGRHKKFKQTEIGEIPEDWEVVELGDVLRKIDAGWSPQCESSPPGPGEWGVLKVSAVSGGVYKPHESKRYVAETAPREDIEVHEGDVLLSRASGVLELVGRTVIVETTPPRLMLSDKTLRLRPIVSRISGRFLHSVMGHASVKDQILTRTGGSHMRNVSQAALRQLVLPLPGLEEQLAIERAAEVCTARLRRERAYNVALRATKDALMSVLLTGELRVRGEEVGSE